MNMHRDTIMCLLLPRLRHPGEKLTFPHNLFCVSPKTGELIVVYCYHPLSLARGYTQGGFIAAISYCFPSDTAQEIKVLQETLNRAPIGLSLKFRDTMGPIHAELTG